MQVAFLAVDLSEDGTTWTPSGWDRDMQGMTWTPAIIDLVQRNSRFRPAMTYRLQLSTMQGVTCMTIDELTRSDAYHPPPNTDSIASQHPSTPVAGPVISYYFRGGKRVQYAAGPRPWHRGPGPWNYADQLGAPGATGNSSQGNNDPEGPPPPNQTPYGQKGGA